MRRLILTLSLLFFLSPFFGGSLPNVYAAESRIDQRFAFDKEAKKNPFVLTGHRATYFLPLTYNFRPNNRPFEGSGEPSVKKTEVNYQISIKLDLAKGFIRGAGDLGFGYTQKSYWQTYDRRGSSPFRETNYEPEAMLSFKTNEDFLGFKARLFRFCVNHQSNGRTGILSRSWNRVTAEALFERGNFYFGVKPWLRLPEIGTDMNPDIYKFMGYGEVTGLYQWGDHQLGFLVRNNLHLENRGAVQLEWNFPLYAKIHGFVQLFEGYGESLIDYNHHTRRIGVGILLANWI